MLSLIRKGPRSLTIVGDADKVIGHAFEKFPMEEKEIRTAQERISEEETILFVSNRERPKRLRCFVTEVRPEEILAAAISSGWTSHIESARNHPRNLLMRLYGDPEPVITQLQMEFQSCRDSFHNLLRRTSDYGVALCFTRRPLNTTLSATDIHEEILLIDFPYDQLYQRLESRALDLFNESIGRRDWTEMEIRVYDAYENYAPHIERLRTALRGLQIGLNLGEGWGTDHARILMPIRVYRIRIFTFAEAAELKKALIGLEHAGSGERLVDMDLFLKGKKLSWKESTSDRQAARQDLGSRMRKELYATLSGEETDILDRLEEAILKQRSQKA